MTCNKFSKTIRKTYKTYVSPHPTRSAQQTADRRVFKNPLDHIIIIWLKMTPHVAWLPKKKEGVPRIYDCSWDSCRIDRKGGGGRKWQKVLTAVRLEPNEPPRLRWLIKLSNYGNRTLLLLLWERGEGVGKKVIGQWNRQGLYFTATPANFSERTSDV